MKTILTILKKEFARIFKDRRLLLSLLLPGILIYCIYSLLGGAIGNIVSPSGNDTYTVAFLNLPDSIGDVHFYVPKNEGDEPRIRAFMERVKKLEEEGDK
mgnify:CR=1 FL=1